MANKKTLLILVSFVVLQSAPLAAFAGGAAFVGVGPGGVSAGVSTFSRHSGSTATIFVRVGNRWVSAPHGYYVAPLYSTYPNPERQYGSADRTGALYVNGYRVQPSGWLRVQVEPRDAEIVVDGFPVTTHKLSGLSNSLGLLIGTHHVEVRKDGFQTYQADLPIQQAREILLRVNLDNQ